MTEDRFRVNVTAGHPREIRALLDAAVPVGSWENRHVEIDGLHVAVPLLRFTGRHSRVVFDLRQGGNAADEAVTQWAVVLGTDPTWVRLVVKRRGSRSRQLAVLFELVRDRLLLEAIAQAGICDLPFMTERLTTWGNAFLDWIPSATAGMIGRLGDLAVQFLGWVTDTANGVNNEANAAFGAAIVNWVAGAAGNLMSALGTVASAFLSWIDNLAPRVESGMDVVGTAIVAAVDKVGPVAEVAAGAVGAAIERGLMAALNVAISAVETWASQIVGIVQGLAGQLVAAAAHAGQSAVDGLVNGITGGLDRVRGAAADLAGAANAAFNAVIQSHSPSLVYAGFGTNMGEGLVMGLMKQSPAVAAAARELARQAQIGIQEAAPVDSFVIAGQDMGDGLELGILRGVPKVQSAAQTMGNSILVEMQGFTQNVDKEIENTTNKLSDIQTKAGETIAAALDAETAAIDAASLRASDAIQKLNDNFSLNAVISKRRTDLQTIITDEERAHTQQAAADEAEFQHKLALSKAEIVFHQQMEDAKTAKAKDAIQARYTDTVANINLSYADAQQAVAHRQALDAADRIFKQGEDARLKALTDQLAQEALARQIADLNTARDKSIATSQETYQDAVTKTQLTADTSRAILLRSFTQRIDDLRTNLLNKLPPLEGEAQSAIDAFLSNVDAAVSTMTGQIVSESASAATSVAALTRAISSIPNKTVTITTNYVSSGSPAGAGTQGYSSSGSSGSTVAGDGGGSSAASSGSTGDQFSTYAGRQAYRDANPGAIVDASGAYFPSGRAVGGEMQPGELALVGEKGPEFFRAGASGGYVFPNGTAPTGGDSGATISLSAQVASVLAQITQSIPALITRAQDLVVALARVPAQTTVAIGSDTTASQSVLDRLRTTLAALPAQTMLVVQAVTTGQPAIDSLQSVLVALPAQTTATVQATTAGQTSVEALRASLAALPLQTAVNVQAATIGQASVDALRTSLANLPAQTTALVQAISSGQADVEALRTTVLGMPAQTTLTVQTDTLAGQPALDRLGATLASLPRQTALSIQTDAAQADAVTTHLADTFHALPRAIPVSIQLDTAAATTGAQTLGSQLGAIPRSIPVNVVLNTSDGVAAIRQLTDSLDDVPRNTVIHTTLDASAGLQGLAQFSDALHSIPSAVPVGIQINSSAAMSSLQTLGTQLASVPRDLVVQAGVNTADGIHNLGQFGDTIRLLPRNIPVDIHLNAVDATTATQTLIAQMTAIPHTLPITMVSETKQASDAVKAFSDQLAAVPRHVAVGLRADPHGTLADPVTVPAPSANAGGGRLTREDARMIAEELALVLQNVSLNVGVDDIHSGLLRKARRGGALGLG